MSVVVSENTPESMAWAARPTRELVRLAIPISVSMLSYSVMTLVGTLFVSRLGATALAGVGLGSIASFALLCFPMGALGGVKVLVAQSLGAQDTARARAYAGAGVAAALGLAVLVAFLSLGTSPLLLWLSGTPEAGALAQKYFHIRMLGIPMLMLYMALREGSYGFGDSRSPMLASVSGNVLNAAVDYVLIVRLGFGVEGAAWGAVSGQLLEAALLAALHARARRPFWDSSRQRLVELWRMGGPLGIQFALEVGSFATLAVMTASMGDVQMSAHQIGMNVVQFSFLPAYAIGEASAVLSGRSVGARRDHLVLMVAHRALAIACGYALLCATAFAFGGHVIVAGFTRDPVLARAAEALLFLAGTYTVFDAAAIVAKCVLRGTGDVRFCATTSVVSTWLLLPPLTWALGKKLGWGALGGWTGICVLILVLCGLFWFRLQRGSWKTGLAARRAGEQAPAEPALVLSDGALSATEG